MSDPILFQPPLSATQKRERLESLLAQITRDEAAYLRKQKERLEEAMALFEEVGIPHHATPSAESSAKKRRRSPTREPKAKLRTQFTALEQFEFESFCRTTKKWERVFEKYSEFSKPFIRKQGLQLQRAGNWDPLPLVKEEKKPKVDKEKTAEASKK